MLPFYLFFNYLFITEPPGQGQPTNIPIHALKDWNCQNTIRSEKRKNYFWEEAENYFRGINEKKKKDRSNICSNVWSSKHAKA